MSKYLERQKQQQKERDAIVSQWLEEGLRIVDISRKLEVSRQRAEQIINRIKAQQ